MSRKKSRLFHARAASCAVDHRDDRGADRHRRQLGSFTACWRKPASASTRRRIGNSLRAIGGLGTTSSIRATWRTSRAKADAGDEPGATGADPSADVQVRLEEMTQAVRDPSSLLTEPARGGVAGVSQVKTAATVASEFTCRRLRGRVRLNPRPRRSIAPPMPKSPGWISEQPVVLPCLRERIGNQHRIRRARAGRATVLGRSRWKRHARSAPRLRE